jgi:hypothetical protein
LALLKEVPDMRRPILCGLIVPLAVLACNQAPDLDIETFNLAHRSGHEAAEIIHPYVFQDREGAPGTMSATQDAISVRETRDNLDKIARVIQEFDQPQQELRLRFQLIEADSFEDEDPEIATIAGELRGLFRFEGYRLLGEALVTVADEGSFRQRFLGPDEEFLVDASAELRAPGTVRLHQVTLWGEGNPMMETTVNASMGQTLVIGGTRARVSGRSFILSVAVEQG